MYIKLKSQLCEGMAMNCKDGLCLWQVRGGALLDGKLEEYEAAWMAAGGEDISTRALGDLFRNLGQPLDAYRCFMQDSLSLSSRCMWLPCWNKAAWQAAGGKAIEHLALGPL